MLSHRMVGYEMILSIEIIAQNLVEPCENSSTTQRWRRRIPSNLASGNNLFTLHGIWYCKLRWIGAETSKMAVFHSAIFGDPWSMVGHLLPSFAKKNANIVKVLYVLKNLHWSENTGVANYSAD